MNDAGVDPLDVSYIEMHGTGTQAGDMVEMTSVLDIFASGRSKRNTEQLLYLGSAKSNIGHAESASGVASLIKILLMMKKDEIPPHCGIKTQINHGFPKDLKERGIRIPFQPTPWLRNGGTRRAFLNNFSAAGGNTALLLEDAPVELVQRPKSHDPRSIHLVAVSARTIPSLKKNLQSLIAFVEKKETLSLSDLSYTTTARRIHHDYRIIVRGSNITSIKNELEKAMSRLDLKLTPTRKVAFAFTGQGSQYAGMGKHLFQSFSQFRSDILRFDRIGMRFGFPSIQPLIDGTGPEQDLSPLVTQLGLTCLQMALARLWASWGVQPGIVVGHSLGEYAALNISGVLSIHDTIYLVGRRAQILQEKCTAGTHSMLAVKASIPQIASMSQNRTFEYACINGPEQVVLSGSRSEIEDMLEVLKCSGIKCTTLAVPYAFHSSQVEPILQDFESAARGVQFKKPLIPIISPLLSGVISGDEINATYLSRHCREVVDFEGGLNAAERSNLTDNTIWVEIGPSAVVAGMIKATLGSTVPTVPSLHRDDTWGALTQCLSTLHSEGNNIQWSEYHRDFEHTVLQLPAYNWDYKNYWIQYVHDWCLTKGDPPSMTAAPQLPKFPPLSTTTVHKVVDLQVEDSRTSVVIESDLSDENLRTVLQGHTMNGAALCPSVSSAFLTN
jgi:naphtho-gamma-pyrone polyketide synthase